MGTLKPPPLNKGTKIDNVINYLEKQKELGLTHVAVMTKDGYIHSMYYNNVSGHTDGTGNLYIYAE